MEKQTNNKKKKPENRSNTAPYLQPRSCPLGFNQYFGKAPSFAAPDCHSSPSAQRYKPGDSDVLPADATAGPACPLPDRCHNKSLRQPRPCGDTSFKGRSPRFGQVPVVSESPAGAAGAWPRRRAGPREEPREPSGSPKPPLRPRERCPARGVRELPAPALPSPGWSC